MQCPNCGNAVKPESKFCPRCAFNLRQAAKPPVESAPEREADSFEKKWEQAAQQYGRQAEQQAPRQPEPPAAGKQPDAAEAATAQSCPRCRAAVKPGQKFCMSCAAPLGEGAPAQPAQPAQMQGQPQPMPAYPQQQMQAQNWGAQQQAYQTPQSAGSNKMIIAIIVGVLVLAGAGVGAYFLFLKDKGSDAGNTNGQVNQSAVAGNSNRQASTTNTNTRTTPTTNTGMTATGLSGVVNTLLQAMKDGDANALRSNIARNASTNADAIMTDVRAKGEMRNYKLVRDPEAFEDKALASFTIDWASGSPSTGIMYLVKEDGAWKLDNFLMY